MAFRSAGAVTNLNGTTNVSVPAPSGVVDGDTIVLVISSLYASETTAPSVPAGFSLAWSCPQGLYASGLYVYTKAASSEPASYSVNQGFNNGNGAGRVVALAYSGRDNTSLIVATSTQSPASQPGVTSVSLPPLTATDTGQDYFAFAWEYNGRSLTLSAGSGLTLRASASGGGNTVGAADLTSTSAGSISGKTLTSSAAGDYKSGALLFAKASGGGNSPPTFTGPNIGNQTGTVGTALTSNNIASKFSDTDALTFSAVGTWPPGVTVSSAGVISGTPTTAGTYSGLSVRATDTAAQTVDSDTFTFTISAAVDTTAPTLTGSITISSLTTTSYTASWPAGSDNVAVTGYQYRIASGSWVDAGNVLTVNITGRTPGATESFEVRAYDAAANYSTPALSTSVTLNSAATGTITLPALKDWGTGNLKANETGVTIIINNASTGVLVNLLTSQTANASGVLPTLTGLVSGTAYRVTTILADGSEGTWKYTAS